MSDKDDSPPPVKPADSGETPKVKPTVALADGVKPRSTWIVRAAALLVPVLILFPTLGSGGIWDPYELNGADLARRIAIHVWGAQSLQLADADNTMPTLELLGKGELPFTSIGAGFAAFGLHEWAGRLPLVFWALAGIAAIYWMLCRLMDEKAGAYGAIVLVTMPLYFVQARTMLGDIVTMAAVAIAVSGLAVLVFDDRAANKHRIIAGALALLGLAAAFMARGILIGLALPLLTVGLTWMLTMVSVRDGARARQGTVVGLASLVAGLACALYGAYVLSAASGAQAVRLLGTVLNRPSSPPSFEDTIMYLGHGLFPWSAFVPFAVGRLFRPGCLLDDAAAGRERALRGLVLLGASLSFGILTLLNASAGHIPFAGVAFLACIAAITIRDLERGAPASRTLAVGVVTFLFLFYQDFKMWPEKGLSPFGVIGGSFPDTFKHDATRLILIGVVACSVLVFASWLERDEPGRSIFSRKEYLQVPRTVRTVSNGNLSFLLIVIEAALAGFAILFFIGLKLHWKTIVNMSATLRMVAINAWWAAPLGFIAIVLAAFAFRDFCRWFFPATRITRASATLAGGAVAGAILAFSYYPALAAQLSPKEVFESYAKLSKQGEPLALLGVNSRAATYYAGGDTQSFSDIDSALNWLLAGDQRKWLVLRDEDLPRLNSTFRARKHDGQNLPVLDARSSQILLASNELRGEPNLNPLSSIILPEKPAPSHPLDVDLQGQLRALGWDVVTPDGAPVDAVVAGRKYRLRLYYEVTGRITRDWKSFVHIDGHQRRFNGDHDPMDKKYPMTLWQVGDFLVDDLPFDLEPNFTPGGYMLYYGFFVGDTRLKVTRGKHHENRIEGGIVQVK